MKVRNPYDAILAEWNRRRSPKGNETAAEGTHTGVAPPELFNATIWTKQCAGYTSRWRELHEKYAKSTPKKTKILIVQYEELKANLRFKKYQKFLH